MSKVPILNKETTRRDPRMRTGTVDVGIRVAPSGVDAGRLAARRIPTGDEALLEAAAAYWDGLARRLRALGATKRFIKATTPVSKPETAGIRVMAAVRVNAKQKKKRILKVKGSSA